MATVVNRNERRREQTRQKLVTAATTLFVSKGFNETTIDEVCAHADVAKVTFYYHFQSKDDIVKEIKAEATREVFSQPINLLEHKAPALEILSVLVHGIATWTEAHWKLLQVFLGQKFQHVATHGACSDSEPNSLVNLLTRIVEHGIETGEFKKAVQKSEVAAFIALAIFNQQVLWLHNERKTSLSADFNRCIDFILYGIAKE